MSDLMTQALRQRVRQARRRMWMNRWLSQLGWAVTVAAGVLAVLVLVQRLAGLVDAPGPWWGLTAAGLAAGACLAAGIWMWMTRESLEMAAARVDEASGFKERISTALYCDSPGAGMGADPFAQAVMADAQRFAGRVCPRDCIPIYWPKSGRYAAGAVLGALGLLWLFPQMDLVGRAETGRQRQQKATLARQAEAEVTPVLSQIYQKVSPKLGDQRKPWDEADPLKNARLDTPLDVRRTAVKKVEQLADRLRRRRDAAELQQVAEFKKLMRRLARQASQPTPAGKLAGALARGDLASARAALAALQKQLDEAPKTPEQKLRAKELKAQLKALSDALVRLGEEDQKAASQLQAAGLSGAELKEAEALLKDGDFKALEEKLAAKGLSEEALRRLMRQCRSRCRACDSACRLGRGLSGSLGMAQAQLAEMESLEGELDELDAMLTDLDCTKSRLGSCCKRCKGSGMCNGKACGVCNGLGFGRGGGIGLGPDYHKSASAPQKQLQYKRARHRAPIQPGRGRIISQQFIGGEQFKGEVSPEFAEVSLSAEREVTDAIARERIPPVYHTAVKKYFTRFGESVPEDQSTHSQGEK